jgi:hypothetical protein
VVSRISDESSGYFFEFESAKNEMVKKIIFPAGRKTGAWPQGNLSFSSNSSFCGMTKEGAYGMSENGVLYEFNPSDGTLTRNLRRGITPLYSCLTEAKGGDTPAEETRSFR